MKYYSELLDKMFDSEEDLNQAEKNKKLADAKKNADADRKKAEKKAAATRVEDSFKKAKDAYSEADRLQRDANKELSDFCKKYGYYHTSITSADDVFAPFRAWTHFFDDFFE